MGFHPIASSCLAFSPEAQKQAPSPEVATAIADCALSTGTGVTSNSVMPAFSRVRPFQ